MDSTVWIIIGIVAFVVLFSAALAIANHSSERFMQEYEKVGKIYINEGIDVLDFVHMLNHQKFDDKLRVQEVKEDTNNFYYSKKKVVGLSKRTLTSNSLASFAIVAHEMGHAMQDKNGSKLKIHNFLRKFGAFVGYLFLPAIIVGIVLLFFGVDFRIYSYICFGVAGGILLLAILIKTITISIEKDASRIGVEFLKEIMSDKEVSTCKKLLNKARLTYWGDLFRLLLAWTFLTRKTPMFR